jgi:site-specific DNA-methyltransferase (adenine-specific)
MSIHHGDCIEVMATMPEASVDAIVTDPPYGLEFMGKGWDAPWKQGAGIGEHNAGFGSMDGAPDQRPGHAGGTWFGSRDGKAPTYLGSTNPTCRTCGGTQHGNDRKSRRRCQCDKPDFPNTIAPRQIAFQEWCEAWGREALRVTKPGGYLLAFGGTRTHHRLVCGLEDAGWIIRDELDWIYASGFPKGKANLKPAHEPIVLARKPGKLRPLGIDECRIGVRDESKMYVQPRPTTDKGSSSWTKGEHVPFHYGEGGGRWPSNVLLSDPELFDEPNPEVVGSGATAVTHAGTMRSEANGTDGWGSVQSRQPGTMLSAGDSGGYSRFSAIPRYNRTCVRCGATIAAGSSRDGTTPAIPSDSADGSVSPIGSDETVPSAPSAASSTRQATTPTAPTSAPTSGDEGSGSRSEAPSMSASEPTSWLGDDATTKPTRRSKRRGTSPASERPSGPAKSPDAASLATGTTTTTPSRSLCATCV